MQFSPLRARPRAPCRDRDRSRGDAIRPSQHEQRADGAPAGAAGPAARRLARLCLRTRLVGGCLASRAASVRRTCALRAGVRALRGRLRGQHRGAGASRRSRSPRAASVLVAWIGCSIAVRLVAASFVAVALGVSRPVSVALVLLAAFAVSGVVPLTPGNFGAGPGAAPLALHGAGVSVGSSLALGLAFQAAETYS